MGHPLLDVKTIDQAPQTFLASVGTVFEVFDERTQDSGNVSYGVAVSAERFFVKSAGKVDNPIPLLCHSQRVSLLRNAIELHQSCTYPALLPLIHTIDSSEGPLLVYPWFEGLLLHANLPRIRALPEPDILSALDALFELHDHLTSRGWVAVDFYDGCLMYDFHKKQLKVMDLDHYHRGSFINDMGRMFGSTRFMSPEEFNRGATIDERTTVYTMGRAAAVLLSDGSLERRPFRGSDAQFKIMCQACNEERHRRYESMHAFLTSWRDTKAIKVTR